MGDEDVERGETAIMLAAVGLVLGVPSVEAAMRLADLWRNQQAEGK
jgi:hypothetical protein